MQIGKHEVLADRVTISQVEFTDRRLVELLESLTEEDQKEFLIGMLKFSSQLAVQAHNQSEIREMDSLVEKVSALFEDGAEEFEAQFLHTLNNQLDENKHGSLVSLLRTRLVNALVQSLMPSNENSPLHEIKIDLQDLLRQASEQKGLKKGKSKSGIKGQEFEIAIHALIADESVIHGDTANFTGDLATASGDKSGDTVVDFSLSELGGFRVVWESKTQGSFKSAKGLLLHSAVRMELQKALTNRDADCAVFVADSPGLELQPEWQLLENDKLMIVINPEEPDQRLIRLAYLWSKSVAARKTDMGHSIDFAAIENGLGDLDAAVNSYKTLKAAHTKIETGLTEARGIVEMQQASILAALQRLRSAITPNEEA